MSADVPRGRNHRCGHTPYVGGVPTVDGELVWRRTADGVERVRSRKQLDDTEELLVVPARLGTPDAAWWDNERPDGVWSGPSDAAGMRRSGVDLGQRAATLSAHPHLARRFATAPLVRTRPQVDPLGGTPEARCVLEFSTKVRSAGGRVLVVGGSVRDAVYASQRGERVVPKDLDVEVFGVPEPALEGLLAQFGPVDRVGADFPVYLLEGVEVAVPRTERKVSSGRRGFDVTADPTLPPERAVQRRDFTVNALMFDPLDGQLIDHVGGVEDLRAGVLRHVSDAFGEDPLRVLRAGQFISRFGFTCAPETAQVCRDLLGLVGELPGDRVYGEFDKLLTKGTRPGDGLVFLDQVGWLSPWPQLDGASRTGAVPTAARALNQWAADRSGDDAATRGLAVLGWHLDRDGAAIQALVDSWMPRRQVARDARALIGHTRHAVGVHGSHCPPADVRRLSLAAGGLAAVCELARSVGHADVADALADTGGDLGVYDGPPQPLVQGRDLVDAGFAPGKWFGQVLNQVFDEQLDGRWGDRAAALARLLELAAARRA